MTPSRRKVSDEEYAELEERFPFWNRKKECPTCHDLGVYRYGGEEVECDCRGQKALERLYLLANIGKTYHTLGFDDLYSDKEDLRALLLSYIEGWGQNGRYGRGITFFGPLGTGKTFAQVLILKELIKLGHTAWFNSFPSAVSDYVVPENRKLLDHKIRWAEVFALDELVPPVSDRQRDLYEEVAERVIRFRVENSMPTLLGTNMTPEQMEKTYPRITSLLCMTQIWHEIDGEDVRQQEARKEVNRLIDTDEVRPIK